MEKIYFIKHEKQLVAIKIEDVNLIEAMGDYVKVHTPQMSYVIHSTMKYIRPNRRPEQGQAKRNY